MVSSSSAFDDDDDDDDDVSFLLSKSFSSSSPSFFFESATRRILFRRPRCVRPRSKRVLVARVERRTKRFEKVEEDDDDDENHGAERTAPPPTRTVKEDVVMFSREHYTTLCRLCVSSKFFRRSMRRSLALSSLKARVSRFNSSAERRGRPFPQRYDVANANEEQHQRRRHHQRRRRIRISTQRK